MFVSPLNELTLSHSILRLNVPFKLCYVEDDLENRYHEIGSVLREPACCICCRSLVCPGRDLSEVPPWRSPFS